MPQVKIPVYSSTDTPGGSDTIGFVLIDEHAAQLIQALLPKMQQAPVVQVAPGVFDGSPWAPKTSAGATESREDRIRRLAKQCGFENSQSVVGALKQLENELEQENQRCTQRLLEEVKKYKSELELHNRLLSNCACQRESATHRADRFCQELTEAQQKIRRLEEEVAGSKEEGVWVEKELAAERNKLRAECDRQMLKANELHRQIEGLQKELVVHLTATNNEKKVKLAALQRAEEYAQERDAAQNMCKGLKWELEELKNQGVVGGIDVLKLVGARCDALKELLQRVQVRLDGMNQYISARNLGQPAEEEFMKNEKVINAIKEALQ